MSNSTKLYTFASDLKSLPQLEHFHNIESGSEKKLQFLFLHIKIFLDKSIYKLFLQLMHFII